MQWFQVLNNLNHDHLRLHVWIGNRPRLCSSTYCGHEVVPTKEGSCEWNHCRRLRTRRVRFQPGVLCGAVACYRLRDLAFTAGWAEFTERTPFLKESSIELSFRTLSDFQVQSRYLNPENEELDEDGYYSDDLILNRVPSVFLLLGSIYGIIQVQTSNLRINA